MVLFIYTYILFIFLVNVFHNGLFFLPDLELTKKTRHINRWRRLEPGRFLCAQAWYLFKKWLMTQNYRTKNHHV